MAMRVTADKIAERETRAALWVILCLSTARGVSTARGNAHDQDHSPSCYPNAGCQDHSVRRTGEVRLGIHTHRKAIQSMYQLRLGSC